MPSPTHVAAPPEGSARAVLHAQVAQRVAPPWRLHLPGAAEVGNISGAALLSSGGCSGVYEVECCSGSEGCFISSQMHLQADAHLDHVGSKVGQQSAAEVPSDNLAAVNHLPERAGAKTPACSHAGQVNREDCKSCPLRLLQYLVNRRGCHAAHLDANQWASGWGVVLAASASVG